jgi:uncharacterized protein
MTDELAVPGIDDTLTPTDSGTWRVDAAGLTGTAGSQTDMFVDPVTGVETVNAPRLVLPAPDGDFQLSARVDVQFGSTFDAGVLLLWADARRWAKLCFEFSPDGDPMVVSVVTRGVSDDANAFTVTGPTAWLRVSKVSGAYAYHASLDGQTWQFVRQFNLGDGLHVGFEVQSPVGDGCVATFSHISLTATTIADLRDGS